MTFSIGQPEQTGLDAILGGAASGVAQGLQQRLEQFHEQKEKKAKGDQFESLGLPRELAGLDPQVIKQFMAMQQKQSIMDQFFGSPQQDQGAQSIQDDQGTQPLGTPQQAQPTDDVSATDVQGATLLDPNLGRALGQERKIQQQAQQKIKDRNFGVFDKASADLKSIEDADTGIRQLQKLSNTIGETQGQKFFERFARTYRFDSQGGFTKIGKATSTPQEERYVKLIADQTKNIKNDFGARVTNLDLQVFLRRFPDLLMSPAGRKAIFETMRDYHEAKRVYNQALKNEVKSTKGMVDPYELDEIVETKIAPKLDKIRERIERRGFGIEEQEGLEGQTATNPQTGEKMILRGGKWQAV